MEKPVIWLCTRQFRMKDGVKQICFTNGKLYQEVIPSPLTLIDDEGIQHELSDAWIKWFRKI